MQAEAIELVVDPTLPVLDVLTFSLLFTLLLLIASSGFVFQFGVGVILGCWVAQLVYMVILLHFPFFGERALTKKKTYFHVVSLVLIISLSLIGPVVALARFNYVTIRFPPFLCLPSSQIPSTASSFFLLASVAELTPLCS